MYETWNIWRGLWFCKSIVIWRNLNYSYTKQYVRENNNEERGKSIPFLRLH